MNERITAITLRSIDYKENDKLLWLFSAEYGKFIVTAKGVKKAGAKLRYAAEPFCFGDFEINKSADKYVLTGCTPIEGFYELRNDISGFYAGSVMLEAVSKSEEKDANPPLFLLLIKSLGGLLTDTPKDVTLIKFLLDYISLLGYSVTLSACNQCGAKNFDKLFFDPIAEGFVCVSCRTGQSVPVSPPVISTLNMIDKMDIERLHIIKVRREYLLSCINVLSRYIELKVSALKTLAQYISISQTV